MPFIEPIADHPEVIAVVREATETQGFAFGGIWHSDFSFLPEPPMGSILHALEVPPYGGDTLFANQYLAFETLSRGLQTTLRGLTGLHSARDAYSPKMQKVHDMFAGMTVHTSEDANRVQRHPVVRRNPETGRDALYVNRQYTVGLDRVVADRGPPAARLPVRPRHPGLVHVPVALGGRRRRVLGQPLSSSTWRWATSRGHRRAMHRTTVAGERPEPERDGGEQLRSVPTDRTERTRAEEQTG